MSCEGVYDLFCDGIGNFCTCKALYVIEQSHPKGMDCKGRDKGCCLLIKLSVQRKSAMKKLNRAENKVSDTQID